MAFSLQYKLETKEVDGIIISGSTGINTEDQMLN
jgi:molybdopterin biosynthesis enzyme MoaB